MIAFSLEKLKGNQRKQRDRIDKPTIPSFLSWEKKSMMIFICGNCIFGQWEAGSFFDLFPTKQPKLVTLS